MGVAGWCVAENGELEKGLGLATQAIVEMQLIHSRHFLPYLFGLLADVHFKAGHEAAATKAVQDGLATAEATDAAHDLAAAATCMRVKHGLEPVLVEGRPQKVPTAIRDDGGRIRGFAAKTVPELIAYAKANPGRINLGSSGTGNLSHLSGGLFRMMTGIEVVHVPYRGTPAAHSALLAGDVHVIFDAVASSLPHIQSGALRARSE